MPDEFWIGRQMMCWNYDKTPWEEFPDMSISLLSSVSNSKEFRLKIPPQVKYVSAKMLATKIQVLPGMLFHSMATSAVHALLAKFVSEAYWWDVIKILITGYPY